MGLVKAVFEYGAGTDIVFPVDGLSLVLATGEVLSRGQTAGVNDICNHFKNTFTIAQWVKPNAALCTLLDISISPTGEAVRFTVAPDITTWRVDLDNSSGFLVKRYQTPMLADTWQHLVIVVKRSASEQLKMYINGVKQVPTKVVDTPLPDRENTAIEYISVNPGSVGMNGSFHSMATWNRALSNDAILKIYNNGNETFNLLKNSGAYQKRKYLQHWWVPELDSSTDNAMGTDYGRAGTNARRESKNEGLNIMLQSIDITVVDDLVGSTPSGR
jgi:hypothetical protein